MKATGPPPLYITRGAAELSKAISHVSINY